MRHVQYFLVGLACIAGIIIAGGIILFIGLFIIDKMLNSFPFQITVFILIVCVFAYIIGRGLEKSRKP